MTQVINDKLKKCCKKCQIMIGKPCAWLSLGNEYCDEIMDVQQEIESQKRVINGMIDNEEQYCLEINGLNNIINELEKYLKKRIDFYKQEIKEFQDDLFTSNYEEIEDAKNEIKIRRCHIIELEDTLDKIEELKGSDKE